MPRDDFTRREDDAPQEGEGTMKTMSVFGRLALVCTGLFAGGTGIAAYELQLDVALFGALLTIAALTLADHDAEFCASRRGRAPW